MVWYYGVKIDELVKIIYLPLRLDTLAGRQKNVPLFIIAPVRRSGLAASENYANGSL